MQNSYNLIVLINIIFFLSIRVFFIFYSIPFFNKYLNLYIKVYLSVLLSFVTVFYIPSCSLLFPHRSGLIVFFVQIFVGTFFGLCVNLIFSITHIAGEISGLQTGLSFFNFFDNTNRTNFPVLSRFFNILFIFIFLSLNGHFWIIMMLVKSFYIFPFDCEFVYSRIILSGFQLFEVVFFSGIQMIFPFILILLCINLIIYYLNKIFPQVLIYSVLFPITSIVVILLLYLSIYYFIPFLKIYCDKMFVLTFDFI
ncbi:flagellar biosynthetic protein FliR [Buchnera aphidicola]|uniref:flagellar biosynthetic protein FliR n=1 Tax=Buchnera aphidicola TaxID=9 RepID=UPI0020923021|nr:flagellar biosynthetic protein FliR [Buchnera aphidicola]USS94187.1 flagellar biosynthetic protein FliR [Buchnera aphidicola (Sipha maydis)]